MLTIELDAELELSLENDAKEKNLSANEIVKNLICHYLNKKKSLTDESLSDDQRKLLERIKNISPVKAPYPSEEMVAMLRAGNEQLIVDARATKYVQ
jgi:hypothetical protein